MMAVLCMSFIAIILVLTKAMTEEKDFHEPKNN